MFKLFKKLVFIALILSLLHRINGLFSPAAKGQDAPSPPESLVEAPVSFM